MSDQPGTSYRGQWGALLGLAILFLVGFSWFAVQVLAKLERVVVVAENLEKKVDQAVQAAAPLGREAVEKGVQTLKQVDTESLGQSATEGVKDIGQAAKSRAIDWIKKQQIGQTPDRSGEGQGDAGAAGRPETGDER